MVDKLQSDGVTRFVIKRVGVVGLGHMGHAFAVNLVEDGYEVLAYDRDPKRAAALTGARPAAGFADLAACDVVLTSLPDDDALAAVALGSEGLARFLAPGAVHISTSTVSPDISRRVAEEHARHRQDYVAAPVLGNPDFARERKLFVLAGGARSAVEKVRPLLERLGQRLFMIGEDAASANLMKLAANALTATTLECMGEVLALLRKGGIDRHLAYDVLTNSLFIPGSTRLTAARSSTSATRRPDSPYGWPPRTCASRSLPPRKAGCQCPRRASSTITLSSWLPAGGRSWTGRLSACLRPSMLA
jgi:3-hydroxyisobutyrate dehydrogenase-like beta-hydroxyacid dehydrogenase